MRKKNKLTLALAVCSVSAAFAGLALSNTTVQATEQTETPVATFAMEKGAAVRAVENEAGIRWTTNVTESWVTDNIPADASEVQFGTFVTSVNNVTVDGKIDVELLNDTTAEVQDLPCDVLPSYTNGTFTYYSSIVYDNMSTWTTEEKNKAYATELIARSYVKYKASGSNTYTYAYATSNNNQRCMRLVAVLAYYETDETKKLTDKQKGYVDDYFIKPEGDKLPTVDFGGYYETAIGKTNSAYTAAYYDGKQVGEADENDTLWVTLGNLGTKNYIIYLFDDAGNCARTNVFRNITRLLYQDKDKSIDTFKDVIYNGGATTIIEGYYVLGSDITLEGTAAAGVTYYGVANTFDGTLDGNGYTISGIYVPYAGGSTMGGLFKTLRGTLKNVSVKGRHDRNSGIIANTCGATAATNITTVIENVYVEAEYLADNAAAPISRHCNGKNIRLVNVVSVLKSIGNSKEPGAVFGGLSKTNNGLTFENCYYITVDGIQPLGTVSGYYGASDVGTLTTFANGLTGYTGATFDEAKTAFDNAVKATLEKNCEVLYKMMYPATAN